MYAIQTYTGIMIDPLNPNAEEIVIEDVAHALSLLCRANGHFSQFYSVGQHSINCMKEAEARGLSRRIQLAALLHDASEAYLSDVTRPVKVRLPQYKEIEAPLQELIWEKWLGTPLTPQEYQTVRAIDDDMLTYELWKLMGRQPAQADFSLHSEPETAFTGFETCEKEFLQLFRRLTIGEKAVFTVGIDWMKPYWIAAEIRGDEIAMRKLHHISEINNYYLDADAVLVDVPIGLPESGDEAALRPDALARRELPGRSSTIFSVPCRQAVYAEVYEEAAEENKKALNKGLPSQSYGFCKTIRQVDEFLAENDCWKNRLMESHPEVAFCRLNHGNGLQYSKHSKEGIAERIDILRRHGFVSTPLLAEFTPKQYEDVLDAMSLAVSAKLGCENGFQTIPQYPLSDSRGLKMQMVFGKE